jgi:hypothetical protein
MTALTNIVGMRFGRLTVVERRGSTSGRQATWLCRCECGRSCVTTGDNLRRNHTTSCGCRSPATYRFWRRVRMMEKNNCWPWTGGLDKYGYGNFYDPRVRRIVRAHRAAWELAYGAVPQKLKVCHSCDNPRCVNPAHLFLGTLNIRDMVAKGRWRCAKRLSPVDERRILTRLKKTYHGLNAELCREYGVGPGVISRLKKRNELI